MIGFNRAKLYGQPYRSGYEGEGTGGGWGDWGGGADNGGGGTSERSDLADTNAGGASLTGGNLATGGAGWGFAPGPVTAADAAGWADSLAGNAPADAVIVTPPAPKTENPVLSAAKTLLQGLGAILQIASGNPAAVVSGATTAVSMAQQFAGSPAPSVTAAPEGGGSINTGAQPVGADTGGMAGDAGDGGMFGAPVLAYGGVVIGAPETTTTGAGLGGLQAALAGLLQPANTRQRYAARVGVQPATTAPAIPPVVALAGLAGLIFLG